MYGKYKCKIAQGHEMKFQIWKLTAEFKTKIPVLRESFEKIENGPNKCFQK